METENLKPALKPNGSSKTSTPEPATDSNSGKPGQSKGTLFLLLGIVIVAVVAVIFWRNGSRPVAESATTPTVAVAKATREDLANVVTIPAEFRPYVEVELHAKISGYVDKMNVDIGDKVKAGQLLATLEVPELHDQLHNAMAMEQKTEVDYTNAQLIYQRLQTVNEQHPNLVAQQELDDARTKADAAKAAIAASRAEVERYQTLTNYTRITAPFDGVITFRYADPGALIPGGATSQAQPLVRVSDNYHLRLDFPVSVDYVKDIHVGDEVQVLVDSLGGKTFTGKVSRSMDKVSEDTRTMTVEVEVPNPSLEIVPGMYASVQLKINHRPSALAVPILAVSGEKQPTVYLVNASSEIEQRQVTLGVETPNKCEILSGLKEGDSVMVGNRAFVQPGQKVDTKPYSQPVMP